ncbi:MAG: AAA family ATPase, partial [Bdellovibrionales bacterium]|nr:AAA family ATPase [Bdellovibrionales bacterium]
MIRRKYGALLKRALRSAPVVLLLGPRQCGKTTLAKTLSPDYYDAEKQEDILRLNALWGERIRGRALVIDEAQMLPEVFPRIRAAVDENRKANGQFLLLGSVSPSLMRQVSESLAGRTYIVEMTPFLLTELPKGPVERSWIYGGFPDGGILNGRDFQRWQADYLDLLARRDLPMWGLPAKPQITLRLFRMIAALHGQEWNATEVGG